MNPTIRIGTRESELAVWQAELVRGLLTDRGYSSTLVPIKSEGDIDLTTPLYEMGVQGIFTKRLDTALLNNTIDIAVHSMKDVPTMLPEGIIQGAVLKRGNYKDLFVANPDPAVGNDEQVKKLLRSFAARDYLLSISDSCYSIASSSIRRKAQWLNRYPGSIIENLRGNVNTRLQKLADSHWHGAIFAAAGLERINLRPPDSIELDWMLPAPAQGAIIIVCRKEDTFTTNAAVTLNDEDTALCTFIERDFLRALLGGCSTPISALAQSDKNDIYFKGNILSIDGRQKITVEKIINKNNTASLGKDMAAELLKNGGHEIADSLRNAR